MTTTNSPAAASAKTWGMLILLGALWGGSFFFSKIAVKEIPPFWLVFFRVSIAALALHLYLLASGKWHEFKAQPFLPFFGLGLLNNAIPFSLLFFGQTVLGAGLASILNATTPFLTVIAATLLTKDEKANSAKVLGIIIGIIGAATIVGQSALTGLGAPLWAQLAVVGAALSYALAAVYSKRFKGVPPLITATGMLTSSTLIMGPIALFVSGAPAVTSWHLPVWGAVLALALASTAFAYLLFFRIVGEAGATFVSLVTLIVPASAVLLGSLFLGETLSGQEIFGMFLIAVGLFVTNGLSYLKSKPKP